MALGPSVKLVQILSNHKLDIAKYEWVGKSYAMSSVEPPSKSQMEQHKKLFKSYDLEFKWDNKSIRNRPYRLRPNCALVSCTKRVFLSSGLLGVVPTENWGVSASFLICSGRSSSEPQETDGHIKKLETDNSIKLTCPVNSGHLHLKRPLSECYEIVRIRPALNSQGGNDAVGGCRRSRCTLGWRLQPRLWSRSGNDARVHS